MMIKVNMEKAREIKRDQLRAERRHLMESLDVAFMRAQESGGQEAIKAISAKKQALRDITSDPSIYAAITPEELKAVRPAALGEETT